MLGVVLPLLITLTSLLFGNDEAEIVFAGDAMMHQGQIDDARRSDGSYDYSEYFWTITPYVRSADYAVVNLETPVAGAPYSGYPCFNSPSSYIDALADAGFDMFLTANNHTLDRRDRGLKATIDSLTVRGLDHIGTYKNRAERSGRLPFIKDINGIRVGFLNYTYGTNGIKVQGDAVVDYIDRKTISRDVDALHNAKVDIIIACVHWGIEYKLINNPEQQSLAQYLQSLGVEIIVGGHPHVIQPMHLTTGDDGRKRLLVYSLGNFISNMKTCDTRGGAVLKLRLTRRDDGVVDIADASYRLFFTEPADGNHGFRLRWATRSADSRASQFVRSARNIFDKYNTGIKEDIPVIL